MRSMLLAILATSLLAFSSFAGTPPVSCHGQNRLNPGAPPLSSFKGPFDGVRMTAELWSHGPAMLSEMKSAGIPWPRFKESEMLDLLAYLNQKEKQ